MYKSQVSAKTAHGDTTKTKIDTLTVPQGVNRIVGVAVEVAGGAGITTLENLSGLFELESQDVNIVPAQFLTNNAIVLTSGVAAWQPKVWPTDIKVVGGAKIDGYITMDLAQTVAGTCRFMLIYD